MKFKKRNLDEKLYLLNLEIEDKTKKLESNYFRTMGEVLINVPCGLNEAKLISEKCLKNTKKLVEAKYKVIKGYKLKINEFLFEEKNFKLIVQLDKLYKRKNILKKKLG